MCHLAFSAGFMSPTAESPHTHNSQLCHGISLNMVILTLRKITWREPPFDAEPTVQKCCTGCLPVATVKPVWIIHPPHVVFTPKAGKHLHLISCSQCWRGLLRLGCDFLRTDRRATLRPCWSWLIRPHLTRPASNHFSPCNRSGAPAPNSPQLMFH